jgi:sulfite exporter TauE/SafE/copper chaperone CopZ
MSPQTTRVIITGMTCSHCEVLVERLVGAQPGVRDVSVNHRSGIAEIESETPVNLEALDAALVQEGYGAKAFAGEGLSHRKPGYAGAAAAFAVVLGVVLTAKHFDVLPRGLTVSDNMTLGFVFVVGLIASVSSCMAVTGGLLVALSAKYNEATTGQSLRARFIPHIYFNAGRLLSYPFFGAVIGTAGAALAPSPLATGILTIAVSTIMIITGLQMLGMLPRLASLVPVLPKRFIHRIHDMVTTESRRGAFVLGAATFFLPCGFTLALQLYALSKGSAVTGAATMLVFALGTLPALLSLSMLSSLATGRLQAGFLKLAGAAVIILGLMNIQYGLVQTEMRAAQQTANNAPALTADSAVQAAQAAPVQSARPEVQTAVMKIEGFDYIPNRFTVKAGIPVRWVIDARDATGCGRVIIMRGAGIAQLLSGNATTIISFTPKVPGELAFNCSMGMMTPGSGFTVTN